jgi:Uma2 family endonuclease
MSEAGIPVEDFCNRSLRVLADRLLETTKVEHVDEGVLMLINPPGIEHRRIVGDIVDGAKRAYYTGIISVNWALMSENYQWNVPDGSGRFYIPDLVFIHPDATTAEEERAAIALVVEVTSPTSPDTDRPARTARVHHRDGRLAALAVGLKTR